MNTSDQTLQVRVQRAKKRSDKGATGDRGGVLGFWRTRWYRNSTATVRHEHTGEMEVWNRVRDGGFRWWRRKSRVIYSLLGTANLNEIDPESYLRNVLTRIADHPIKRIEELLPWKNVQLPIREAS